MKPEERSWRLALGDVFSGCLAGVSVTLVGHPFDTIKVRLQTQPSPPNALYSGLGDCVRKTLAREGLTGFYRGVAAPLVGQLFFRTLLFACNSAYTRYVVTRGSLLGTGGGAGAPLRLADFALGGSLAWAAGTVIECPINVAASQMQVAVLRSARGGSAAEFPSVTAYLRGAPARYGLRAAFYSGFAPHLLRNTLGGAFHFGAFEGARRWVAAERGVPVGAVGLPVTLAAGGLGGVLFWTLTYPIDVVKGCLQADELAADRRRYKGGALQAARELWAEGGAPRFWRGFSACILRAVPANAVVLVSGVWARDVAYDYLGVGGAAGK